MVKSRISKDPNNHRWVKDETTFGQRILRSHGWTPGSLLGAADAPHASLHGAANSSYIRVLLKEDAGGLGYRPGGVSGENDIAGIDEVKDIFARLNGKVETEEEKRERERRKAMVYLGQKVGGITFVRGGFLVQDGLDLIETSSPNPADAAQTTGDQTMASIGKRKAEEESSEGSDQDVPRKKRRKDDESRAEKKRRKEEKRRRRDAQALDVEESAEPSAASDSVADANPPKKSSKKSKAEDEPDSSNGDEDAERKKKKKSKKDKKEKKSKSKTKAVSTDTAEPTEIPAPTGSAEAPKLKKEKKSKKDKKDKTLGKKSRSQPGSETDSVSVPTPTPMAVDSSTSGTPTESGTSTPTALSKGRHIHHARRVAAKRAAMLDAAALKQILAI